GGHGEIAGEGNLQQRVQAGFRQQRFFLFERRDQPRHHVGPQDAKRMGLKGDRNRLAAAFACTLHHLAQNVLVAAMDAVKIAHPHDRGSKVCGNCLQRTEDLHAISNSSFRPSCARRTCSGRLMLVSWCGKSCEMWVKKARLGCSSSTSASELATVECVG